MLATFDQQHPPAALPPAPFTLTELPPRWASAELESAEVSMSRALISL